MTGARSEHDGWTIRPYEPRDEAQALALFARAFGREMAPAVWRWKLGNRSSSGGNRWVVSQDDRVIAHHAGIPLRMKLAGEVREAMISVDAMSAPDLQGRGVQAALMPVIYTAWRSAGIAISWGVASQKWGGLLQTLGWAQLFPLQWLRVPLHVEHVLARKARLPRPLAAPLLGLVGSAGAAWYRRRRHTPTAEPRVEIADVNEASADFDRLWMKLEREYENVVVRDSAWVDWRYLKAPDFRYRVLLARADGEPAGYVAYRFVEAKARRTGIIADLFTAPEAREVAAVLLTAALDDLWSRGAEVARAAAPPGSPLHRLLRAAGFMNAPGEFDFQVVALDPSLSRTQLRDPARWLLTGGDFDVV